MKGIKTMKKLLAVLLAALMLVGCGSKEAPVVDETPVDNTPAAVVKVGAASVTSFNEGSGQWNTTYGVVMTEDGVITAVSFDVAQNTIGNDDHRTKKEKQGDYGMAVASPLEHGEWFEQAAGLEAWLVGKTAADLAAVTPAEADDHGHKQATDADLLTVCTMSIGDFNEVVAKAVANAVEVEGVASVDMHSTTEISDKGEGAYQCNTDLVALAFDANGTIVWANWDVAQNNNAVADAYPTKVEKQDAYGMRGASSLEKGEWFEQAAGMEAWLVGKTTAALEGMYSDAGDGHHFYPNEGTDLAAVCTMSVGSFDATLAKF